MAEAEISIRYRSGLVSLLNRAFFLLLPPAGVFIVWSGAVIMWALCEDKVHGGAAFLFMTAQLLVMLAMVLAVVVTADKTIFITRDGISVPFYLCPGKSLRTEIPWSRLTSIIYKSNGRFLYLLLRDGKRLKLNLRQLSRSDVEQLIVALDVWAGGSENFPALLEARTTFDELATPSSTRLWEDELARRFGATNFIPLEPGNSLRDGQLTVERQLAFGGMSALYVVRDQARTAFVLKEAVVPGYMDDEARERSIQLIKRESHFLVQLQHPNIARVFDYFVENERHYLLLEYVNGSDLRRLVKEMATPVSIEQALQWAAQIAEVLIYLHGQKPPVIHRDLTPDNIVLDSSGRLVVIDFGAANEFLGTATGTMIGKQAYIPPEQLQGYSGPLSDVYSFGCTLFYLLTGIDPEPLSTSRPGSVRKDIPVAVDDLVADCTCFDSSERIADAASLLLRLKEVAAVR